MKMVRIKLDPKKRCRNAYYFLSIERIIMDIFEANNYFDMRISNGEIEITSDNEEIIDVLNRLLKRVETKTSKDFEVL